MNDDRLSGDNQGLLSFLRESIRLSYIPFAILVALVIVPIPFYFVIGFDYAQYMPTIIVIAGLAVMGYGAFSNFGADEYLKDLQYNRSKITNKHYNNIFRAQFRLTVFFVIIGFVFILVGVLIYEFFP